MKKLKRLKIENATKLSVSEMKQILGGDDSEYVSCDNGPGDLHVCGTKEGKKCHLLFFWEGTCQAQRMLDLYGNPVSSYECICHR